MEFKLKIKDLLKRDIFKALMITSIKGAVVIFCGRKFCKLGATRSRPCHELLSFILLRVPAASKDRQIHPGRASAACTFVKFVSKWDRNVSHLSQKYPKSKWDFVWPGNP